MSDFLSRDTLFQGVYREETCQSDSFNLQNFFQPEKETTKLHYLNSLMINFKSPGSPSM